MKTYSTKISDIERKWYVVDAKDQTLGRLATRIAMLLKGKGKAIYTPSLDTGDYVVVINTGQVRVTGKKGHDKLYRRHSGYPGGFKEFSFDEMMAKDPTEVMRHAVKGMLPKNSLGKAMLRKLKLYAGPDHPHQAQMKSEKEKE
ncbi:MAG: 50S ribosomal protein L13 [Chloroflexi bacterium]|nr:50S ribosomal protein L13 [Chloroflexota bacterium]